MFSRVARRPASTQRRGFATKAPKRVTVTGASGQIGYAMLFRIASGQLLGADQPVILQCLELPQAMNALKGVAMELNDCAFPLLHGIVETDSVSKAFEGTDVALLVGAKPRGPGMERGDLLQANAAIFKDQGLALNEHANRDVKVVVVGNPANTNAMITSHFAPNIPKENITAMTRLDHNRGISQLATKTGAHVDNITNFCIWGNHSATQYPDIHHTTIDGKKATDVIDSVWYEQTFIPDVQKRGAAIIAARGASSAASAANSAIEHIHQWVLGTNGAWTSMGVYTDGKTYGIEEGLWYSFPVTCENGKYTIIEDLPLNEFSKQRMETTRAELASEKAAVADQLK